MTNFLSWNCRGSGGMTGSTLNRYLQCTKSHFAFISETRSKLSTSQDRISNLSLRNSIIVPSQGKSGGLWFIWGEEVDASLIEKTKNYIACTVKQRTGPLEWMCIGVYGDPNRVENQAIWDRLEELMDDYQGAICLMGDFNAIAATSEKFGGNSQLSANNKAFRNWFHGAGLIDMGYQGPAYTWSNKKKGRALITKRLDRVLVNLQWHQRFPNASVFHLPRFSSDHMPILIRTDATVIRRVPTFRCENWWTEEEGFKAIVDNLSENGPKEWAQMQKSFTTEVKQWLKDRKTPPVILKQIELEMEQLHNEPPGTDNVDRENDLQRQHQKYLSMNEQYWLQRSRLNWIQSGDNNTRYFHNTAVARKRRNSIHAIISNSGDWVTDQREIRSNFVAHFKAIYSKQQTTQISELFSSETLAQIPKLPQYAQQSLAAHPTDQEITQALMSLGPSKAPGPDGFTAKILQDNWALFGPSIPSEVHHFFSTGHMKAEISRTNLILIPKKDKALKVEHYRPISVCNVIYKIISKLLTMKLKPFVGALISASQSAFVPGRDIAENVVLLREVLHSFKTPSYKNQEFCLKVDLSKAFDRMDWSYIQGLLPMYGIPDQMVTWMMACITSATFTVILNGAGDGFFAPECGLRQGCSLSPYIFIMGMDLLSRALQHKSDTGALRGVRIARTAPALTSCIYADDLLLFGNATKPEAEQVMKTLYDFAAVSGQKVGPEKSSIWFSRATSLETQVDLAMIMSVPLEATSQTYLGAPIATNRESFDFLIDKFSSKLQIWKSKVLSQAGRLVVIKSVLQSLPVYYMATILLPVSVVKKLNALMRRFFWGAGDKTRYMAYISWDTITEPKDYGGLAVRDLGIFNEAMILKSLWKLATKTETLWVQLVIAKYIPRSELWHSKRNYNCSVFWRNLMGLREKMLSLIQWKIGDGNDCTVFGQPWFDQATRHLPQNRQHKNLLIRDLKGPIEGTWDIECLINLFGHQLCMQIIGNIQPPSDNRGNDVIIFKPAKNGIYSVKHAYNQLSGSHRGISVYKDLWKAVWKRGKVVPRVRLFVWKLAQNGLPLAKTIASRTSQGEPICANCLQGDENSIHMIFDCPFARACWFAGPLNLQTDIVVTQPDIKHVLQNLAANLTDEQWSQALNITWSIWRVRNDMAYRRVQPTFDQFKKYLQLINLETDIANSKKPLLAELQVTANSQPGTQVIEEGYNCVVDGSWFQLWQGGAGFILKKDN